MDQPEEMVGARQAVGDVNIPAEKGKWTRVRRPGIGAWSREHGRSIKSIAWVIVGPPNDRVRAIESDI